MPRGNKPGERGPYGAAPKACRTFGDRVRMVRIEWGWSQQRLAEAIGVDQRTISRWERGNGEASPQSAALVGLVGITGISGAAWTSGRGFTFPNPPLDLGVGQGVNHMVPSKLHSRVSTLPDLGPGICLVDPDCEWESRHIGLIEAINALTKAYKAGERAWLILPSGWEPESE